MKSHRQWVEINDEAVARDGILRYGFYAKPRYIWQWQANGEEQAGSVKEAIFLHASKAGSEAV